MTLQRQPGGSVAVQHVDAFIYNTLWELPALADPAGHEGAENRLYPPPYLPGEATEALLADWEEYVRPELEETLGNAFTRVLADLESATREPAPEPTLPSGESGSEPPPAPPSRWTLAIPAEHVEDWFRAMNAARLVMSQRHECHRTDTEYFLKAIADGETARLAQYGLLTAMCDWWITALMQ
jgi:hypothetical protein